MYAKRSGFILIEALLLFSLALVLATLCIVSTSIVAHMIQKGYDDHVQMQQIHQ